MKILMLGWELPPHNSGGLGVACYQLCKELAGRGADIEFVLPYTAAHDIDFMRVSAASPDGVTSIAKLGNAYDSYLYTLADGSEKSVDIFGQQLLFERSVAKLVEHKSFDVIHAHDWLTFRAALRAKEILGRPMILHVHSLEKDRAGGHHGNSLVHEIEYTAFSMADRIIAVSQFTKDSIIREYNIPADKISVVHNSIDTAGLLPFDSANAYSYLTLMKQHGYKVISSVGRLTVQKGLRGFLQAAQKVVSKEPKTLFLIVGAGEQYNELIDLACELGIGKNVIFTGFQRGEAWRDAFAVADLFVLPSVSEPFGLTPLEAIGYGTPALISKQSGVAEVLHSVLKVDHWDVDEMANQILAVVQNPALGAELHRNALAEYHKLSWTQPAGKLLQIYDRELAEHAA